MNHNLKNKPTKKSYLYHQYPNIASFAKDISMRVRGVTLFEVLIAMIIIGILAAVGGPIYTKYVEQSKIAHVLGVINKYRNELQVAFVDNQQCPTSFGDFTAGADTAGVDNHITEVSYQVSADHAACYLSFQVGDIGLPGYESAGDTCTQCKIVLAGVKDDTGHLRIYCGQWDDDDSYVSLEYLPEGCQDTDISDMFS